MRICKKVGPVDLDRARQRVQGPVERFKREITEFRRLQSQEAVRHVFLLAASVCRAGRIKQGAPLVSGSFRVVGRIFSASFGTQKKNPIHLRAELNTRIKRTRRARLDEQRRRCELNIFIYLKKSERFSYGSDWLFFYASRNCALLRITRPSGPPTLCGPSIIPHNVRPVVVLFVCFCFFRVFFPRFCVGCASLWPGEDPAAGALPLTTAIFLLIFFSFFLLSTFAQG